MQSEQTGRWQIGTQSYNILWHTGYSITLMNKSVMTWQHKQMYNNMYNGKKTNGNFRVGSWLYNNIAIRNKTWFGCQTPLPIKERVSILPLYRNQNKHITLFERLSRLFQTSPVVVFTMLQYLLNIPQCNIHLGLNNELNSSMALNCWELRQRKLSPEDDQSILIETSSWNH